MADQNYIGIDNLYTGVGSAGVGFVVVPDETTRDQYIADCYRTMTLAINGGIGYGFFQAVPTSPDVMQNINFPREGNRGTPVVWVKDAVSNLPVVVGYLKADGDFILTQEYQYRMRRSNEGRVIEVFADGDQAQFQINILGDEANPSLFNIKINSSNESSEFNLSCDNKITVVAQNEVDLITNGKFSVAINTQDGEERGKIEYELEKGLTIVSEDSVNVTVNDIENAQQKAQFSYKAGTGYTYTDEFGNKIIAKDGEVDIISSKINLGGGKEKMVLGDTLVSTMGQILDAIVSLTVMTPVGTSGPPLNAAQFTAIKSKLNEILSKLSNTD
jgi:hypothetical protein